MRRLMLNPSPFPLRLSSTPQPNDLCLHRVRHARPSYTELPSTASICRSVTILAGEPSHTRRHYVYHWRLYYHSRDITLDSGGGVGEIIRFKRNEITQGLRNLHHEDLQSSSYLEIMFQ